MKRFTMIGYSLVVFILILSFSNLVFGSSSTTNLSTERLPNGTIHILLQNPVLNQQYKTLDGKVWTTLSLDNEIVTVPSGAPALPSIHKLVRVPDRGNIEVKILNVKYEDCIDVNIIPQQSRLLSNSNSDNLPFTIDNSVYQQNAFYPASFASTTTPQTVCDARVVVLTLSPVQYNPVTHTLRVYSELEVEITSTSGVGLFELTGRHHPVPSFASIYRDIVGTQDLIDECDEVPPGSILIISPNDPTSISLADSLAAWRTISGRLTHVVSVTNGNPQPGDIYNLIHTAYLQNNPPLEYVILAGNTPAIPAFSTINENRSDYGYMCMNGDSLPDIAVSRFPSSTNQSLATHIFRSLNYEKNPVVSDSAWLDKSWTYTTLGMNSVPLTTSTSQYVMEMLSRGGIQNNLHDEFNGAANVSLLNQRIGNGAIFFACLGFWVGELTPVSVSGITNVNKPFVAMLTGEANGWGSQSGSVAEALTELGTPTQPKGAIAAVGKSTVGNYVDCDMIIASGFFQSFGEFYARQPGAMYLSGILKFWQYFRTSTDLDPYQYISQYNMMGDCAVNIWTGVPHAIQYEHPLPSPIYVGQFYLPVTVMQDGQPVAKAQVTAYKPDLSGGIETFSVVETDANGHAVLYTPNRSSGYMTVCVTRGESGVNIIPRIDTLTVWYNSNQTYSTGFHVVNEVIGNGDTLFDHNETLQCTVNIFPTQSVYNNITSTLFSNDSRITFTPPTVHWDTCRSGQYTYSRDTITVQTNSGPFTDNETILLRMSISTYNIPLDTILVPLVIHTSHLSYDHYELTSLNGTLTQLEPGNTVHTFIYLRNTNSGRRVELTPARLVSLTPGVSVVQNQSTYPPFESHELLSEYDTSCFMIQASEFAFDGMVASMRLICDDTIDFTIPVGQRFPDSPSGPETYGYMAYEDGDLGFPSTPAYQWVEINPAFGGTGTKVFSAVAFFDSSKAIPLPFPIQYYGVSYDTLTICENGWVSFGDHHAYTSPLGRRFPPIDCPPNMIAPFWNNLMMFDSTQGTFVKFDSTNHRFIVSWRESLVNPTHPLNEFEVIFLDEQYHSTPTNDASFLFEYKQFHDVPVFSSDYLYATTYATIQICDSTRTRGFDICYGQQYGSGFTPVFDSTIANHAIYFTTQHDTITPNNVARQNTIPLAFRLEPCYPNPFNAMTTIRFSLPASGLVHLTVYDVLGRVTTQLIDGKQVQAGNYSLNWNASQLPSGEYFIKLNTKLGTRFEKVVLVK